MPERTVHHADALTWLEPSDRLAGASVVTSLPDVSEIRELEFDAWRRWFEDAAVLTMTRVFDDAVAIFYQSDVWHAGLWVDKGALLHRAAERAGMGLLFHRIVCREPPGTLSQGRAAYSHLLGFARTIRSTPKRRRADVLPCAGAMASPKSMGVRACVEACLFVRDETPTRTIADPFCGYGTVLAVANALGLDAVGVDISARRCRRARALTIEVDACAHSAERSRASG